MYTINLDSNYNYYLSIVTNRNTDDITHAANLENNYYQNYIKIKSNKSTFDMAPSEILFIKAESNYSTVFLKDGTNVFTSRTLKNWTRQLNQPSIKRVYKSFLINQVNVIKIFKPELFIRKSILV